MLHQILSLVGAALILSAYVANQRGRAGPGDLPYDLANLVGALLLLWLAVIDWRWGFIVLEAFWALATLPGLLRGKRTAS